MAYRSMLLWVREACQQSSALDETQTAEYATAKHKSDEIQKVQIKWVLHTQQQSKCNLALNQLLHIGTQEIQSVTAEVSATSTTLLVASSAVAKVRLSMCVQVTTTLILISQSFDHATYWFADSWTSNRQHIPCSSPAMKRRQTKKKKCCAKLRLRY